MKHPGKKNKTPIKFPNIVQSKNDTYNTIFTFKLRHLNQLKLKRFSTFLSLTDKKGILFNISM